MKNKAFRFIKGIDNEPIINVIYAEIVQSLAEANFGRLLSDKELNRVSFAFWDDDKSAGHLHEAIYTAIETAINDDNNDWSAIDEDFEQSKNK